MSGIKKPGDVIGDGHFLDLFIVACIFKCNGCIVCNGCKDFYVILLKRREVLFIYEFNNADHPVSNSHGNADDGFGGKFAHLIYFFCKQRFVLRAGDDQGPACFCDPAGNPFSDFQAVVSDLFCGFADNDLKIELIFFFIKQKQRPVLRVKYSAICLGSFQGPHYGKR